MKTQIPTLALVALITLTPACGGPTDDEDPDPICLLPDGAEVPSSWDCRTAAGSIVHCDDDGRASLV